MDLNFHSAVADSDMGSRFYQEAQICFALLSGLSAEADVEMDENFARHE